MTNPEITEDLSNKDRFVNKDGLQRIFNVWTQGEALANPLISPIYGQIHDLPPIVIFGGGGREIYHPDMKRFVYNLEEKGQPVHSLSIRKCSMISLYSLYMSHTK